jgi:hypothetical protein
VAADYFAAMARVEGRLEVGLPTEQKEMATTANPRKALLEIAAQLAESGLGEEERLRLSAELREILEMQLAD